MSPYDQEAQEHLDFARRQNLKFLIWGPGNPGEEAPKEQQAGYRKRCQIRDLIRNGDRFGYAKAYFSEDEEMVKLTQGLHNQLIAEAFQALNVDGVIVLDISRGANLELDTYIPTYPWFRDIVYVLLPGQYIGAGGLADEVLNQLDTRRVIGYTQEEFDSCNVATVKAMEIADTVAMAKYLKRFSR